MFTCHEPFSGKYMYSITNSTYTSLFPGMLFCEHPKIQFRAYAKYYLTLSQDMLLDDRAR